MKKLKITLMLFVAAITIGCNKEKALIQTKNSNSEMTINEEFLSLSKEKYSYLVENLTDDFSQSTELVKTSPIQKELTLEEIEALPIPEPINVQELINTQKKIIAKYPQLSNITSILDIYHQALLLDKNELKDFVANYNDYLVLFEEFDIVMLTIPKYKAAMINSSGLIEVANEIIQYSNEGIKVITDGDRSKISQLSNINESCEGVSIIARNKSSEKSYRKLYNSGIVYHPNPNLSQYFQVLYVNYFDLSYVYGNTYYSSMGTEIATLFNGQANNVSTLNLHSYDIGIFAPNSAISFYDGNSEYTFGNNTWSNYTNIRFSISCNRKVWANINSFRIKTDFLVVYANGVPFVGTVSFQ